MDLNKLSLAFSAFWLILIVVRLALYSMPYMNTEGGRMFMMAFNVLLIIGLVIMAYLLFNRFFHRSVATVDKRGHCQQCYAKLSPTDTFCPACGAERGSVKKE